MYYLVMQISGILLAAAATFFAIGVAFSWLYLRQRAKASVAKEILAEPSRHVDPDADAHHALVAGLNAKIESQAKRIESLLQSQSELNALLENAGKVDAPGVTEHALTEPIKLMESALEAQGQLLEKKNKDLEAARLDLDREQDRYQGLTQRNYELEEEIKALRLRVKPTDEPVSPPGGSDERDQAIVELMEMSESVERQLQETDKQLKEARDQLTEKSEQLSSAWATVHAQKAKISELESAWESHVQAQMEASSQVQEPATTSEADPPLMQPDFWDDAREEGVTPEAEPESSGETTPSSEVPGPEGWTETMMPVASFDGVDAAAPATVSVDLRMVERLARLESDLLQKEELWQQREAELRNQFDEVLQGREASIRMLESDLQEMRLQYSAREQEYAAIQHQFESTTQALAIAQAGTTEREALETTLDALRTELSLKANALQAMELSWNQRETGLQQRHQEELERLQRELVEIRATMESEMHEVDVVLESEKDLSGLNPLTAIEPAETESTAEDLELIRKFWEKLDRMDGELHSIDHLVRSIHEARLANAESRSESRMSEETPVLQRRIRDLQVLLEERELRIRELEYQLGHVRKEVHPELAGEDDLSLIRGIGQATKALLDREFGIRTFQQMADLSPSKIEAISKRLRFQGRIERDDWMGQARELHDKKYGNKKPAGSAETPDGFNLFKRTAY